MRERIVARILAMVLTSTIRLSALIPSPDLQNTTTVRREMTAFNPRYVTLMEPRAQALPELERQVMRREAELRDVSCFHNKS